GLRNVLWPMAFRRRQAQHAGRQTVEDSGKDGATLSERCHIKPMKEIPALHNRRAVNQPGCEEWHLKCRRISLPVGRQCPVDQQTTTRSEMPRNRRSGPARDAIDRPRYRLSFAGCRELRAPITVLAADHHFTTECLDL